MHASRHNLYKILLAAVILPLASMAMAATPSTLTAGSFVSKASADGAAEVQLARLALRQGSSADVKQFAQQMIDDHSKANDKLAALARQKGLTTKGPSSKAQATMKRLQGLNGQAFDHAYAQAMVKDHTKAVDLFRTASNSLTDDELKQFAATTLPTLQHHLQMARDLPQG